MPDKNKQGRIFLLDRAKAQQTGTFWLSLFQEEKLVRDLVGGQDLSNPGGFTINEGGSVATFNGAQQQNKAIVFPSGAGAGNIIVAARIKATAAQAGNPGVAFGLAASSGLQTGVGVGFDASSNVGHAWLDSSGAGLRGYSAGALNTYYTVFAQRLANTNAYGWINGNPATTSQGVAGGSVSAIDELVIGAQHRSAGYLRQFKGNIEWAALIYLPKGSTAGTDGLMSDEFAKYLYESNYPYSLEAKPSRIFFASAGGGTTLAITGQEVTAGLGTVLPNINYSLGGQSVTTSVGALVANLNVAITGQVLPVSLGSQVASISTGLAGQAVPLSLGTITVFSSGAVSLAITGQSTMISLGSFIPNTSYSLSGQNISASINNLTSDIMYTLSGQSTPIVLGTVAASVNSTLVGQPVSLTLGSTSASISTVLNGQSVILAQSFLSPIITPSITGQGVLTGLGTITAVGGTNPQYSKNSNLYYNIGNDLSIMLGSPTITTWNNSGRPTGVKVGTFGFNTETNKLEVYTGSGWIGVLLT